MQAKDIMSANVITISPDTAVRDIVATLLRHHISGLPLVDRTARTPDGRLDKDHLSIRPSLRR